MIETKLATQAHELLQILEVQKENHFSHLPADIQKNSGFVTVKHDLIQLEKMNQKARQVIAVDHGMVIGYALVMHKEFKDLIPVLSPMFELFKTIKYQGVLIQDLNYYAMGQICIAHSHKRKGVFGALYAKHKETYAPTYDYCITEVSSSNVPSMVAHQKVGFSVIHTFRDDSDEWNILLWDWS